MKKISILLLSLTFLLTGCGFQENTNISEAQLSSVHEKNKSEMETVQSETQAETIPTEPETEIKTEPNFTSLSDPALHTYIEDSISDKLTLSNTKQYEIENVETLYYSKEFIDELNYNSRENIYFGYTLSELEEQFEGEKYIFTLGEDGKTTVKKFEGYDDSNEKLIRNVTIGAGVILICVTVVVLAPEASAMVAGGAAQVAGAVGTKKFVVALSSESAKKLVKDTSINLLENVVENTIDYAMSSDKEVNFENVLKDSLIDTGLDTVSDISIAGISGKFQH